jgi:hypothetical protein
MLVQVGDSWPDQTTEIEDEMRGSRRDKGAQVGIFWEVRGALIIDGIYPDEAEQWAQFRNYPRGHEELWSKYQRIVPADTEYHQFPRGRVLYDTVSDRFLLYADNCILRKKRLVEQIFRKLRLPLDTKVSPDDHYRCPRCMRTDSRSR